MRHFALLIILLSGCSTSIGDSQMGSADARPIDFRETPDEKEGAGTAPGCDGITARGECQQGTAVYCDLERGRKRTVDCDALGKDCILDIGRGARCSKTPEDPGPGTGEASPCAQVSEAGFCNDGTAVYCDTTGDAPITVTMKCADFGKTCEVAQEGCAAGAFCCGDGTEPEPEPETCGDVTLKGTCDGDTAIWCGQFSGMHMDDCAAENKRCEVDTCASGAYCCGTTSESTPEQLMCAELGFAGECNTAETVATWCSNDEIKTKTCAGEQTCQVDACLSGAWCCDPPAAPVANECTMLGILGECVDDVTVRYCSGTEDTSINMFTCTGTKKCTVNEVGDANCREPVSLCPTIGAAGQCDGTKLQYCTGTDLNTLYEYDCGMNTGTATACKVNDCYSAGAGCCSP
jgi:hypothetical protein